MLNFQGVFTALITPFKMDQSIDEESYRKFIKWQINNGVSGFVASGTTAESPTLNHEEHIQIIKWCVEEVRNSKNNLKIIAGTGSNSTKEAIFMSQEAEKLGVDALLLVTPYYNKPTQNGIIEYYKTIHDNTNIPIIIYNIPGRSVINIEIETLKILSKFERIIGIKDATGNLTYPLEVVQNIKNIKKDFVQLSGDDASSLLFNFAGGTGCISAMSNVVPQLCSDMQNAFLTADYKKAIALQHKLYPLQKALFSETNPIGIKYALSILKSYLVNIQNILRSPLTKASDQAMKQILTELKNLNIELK